MYYFLLFFPTYDTWGSNYSYIQEYSFLCRALISEIYHTLFNWFLIGKKLDYCQVCWVPPHHMECCHYLLSFPKINFSKIFLLVYILDIFLEVILLGQRVNNLRICPIVGSQAPWVLPRYTPKLVSVLRGHRETEERGRPLQIGRVALFISKGIYIRGLSWVAAR